MEDVDPQLLEQAISDAEHHNRLSNRYWRGRTGMLIASCAAIPTAATARIFEWLPDSITTPGVIAGCVAVGAAVLMGAESSLHFSKAERLIGAVWTINALEQNPSANSPEL